MYVAGIHRVSRSVLYLYALCIGGFTPIGIGRAKYRGEGTNGWHWAYTIRVILGAVRKEVSHAA